MNLFVVILCVASICGVKSECKGAECVNQFVNEFLDTKTHIENVDVKIDLPKFEQIKNVEISDLNTILLQLTSWFEDKINETNIIFKNVNDKTKIFVKSFDFNVDFEKGDVKIDVGLTENNATNATDNDKVNHTGNSPLTYDKKPVISIVEKPKEQVEKNEVFSIDEFDTTYYDVDEDNSTDYPLIDYIEMYKDTTNEQYVYTGTELPTTVLAHDIDDKNVVDNSIEDNDDKKSSELPCQGNATCEDFTMAVYPWLVAIFVKNGSNDQFGYYCDGALVSDRVLLTAGRCVIASNKTVDPNDILVFLGKGSLQIINGNEKVEKVKEIIVHDNFTTDGEDVNDFALLVIENPIVFTKAIQSACLGENRTEDVVEAATTAWGLNGELMPIFFNKERSDNCFDKDDNIFCATYGNQVALCPSYGGVYAAKASNRWCLQGIFHGDPAQRGICFTKNVHYTSLNNYTQWIDNVISDNKNDL